MGVDINWGLAGQNNALGMFQQGAQMGSQIRQQREQSEQRNALLELRKQEGAREDAQFAASQEDRAAKQQGEVRSKAQQMARLFKHAAKGPQQWEQAKAAAAQLGFDVSGIPAQFDPDWAAQQSLIVQAFEKDGGQALSTYGKIATDEGKNPGTPEFAQRVSELYRNDQSKVISTQAGGAAGVYNPDDGYKPLIVPNDGSQQFGAPVGADDDEWEVVGSGGAGGDASGGFRP